MASPLPDDHIPNQGPYDAFGVTSEPQRIRLRRDGVTVGYRKTIGSMTFYSKDRYAWRAEPIPSDGQDPWTGLVDRNRNLVFAHDIVVVRPGVLDERAVQAVVLGGRDNAALTLLGDGRVVPLGPETPLERDDLRVIGQAWRHPGLWAALVGPKPVEYGAPSSFDGWFVALWQAVAVSLAGFGELQALGSVGPLECAAALWLGSGLALWHHRRMHGPVLSRRRIRQLGAMAAWRLGAFAGLVAALGVATGRMPVPWFAPPVLGVVFAVASFVCVLTAGDAGTLLTEGYDGEEG